MIKSILKEFPKRNLSVLPVAIHRLDKLSTMLNTNIYCMRDDLTGFAFGGNKTRKLDYLIADAWKHSADTLIAVGGVQSNFCRIVSAAGKVSNIDVHLILAGEKPTKPKANLLLDQFFGSTIHYVDSMDLTELNNASNTLAQELQSKGKHVYFLPPGGSTPIGILGYVAAFGHIANFSRQKEIFFNTIIHATGSGGTQAGLIVGENIVSGWSGKIIGINVGFDKHSLYQSVSKLITDTSKMLKLEGCKQTDIIIDNTFIGAGYGIPSEKTIEAMELFAYNEGIVLDKVYTAKAASALIAYCREGRFNKNDNVLFIHTGGNVHFFT